MSGVTPRQIGPYQVLELLGQGTMSLVYRATLPLLGGQEFAVKLLRERCKPGEVSGFLGECAKVKRLGTHPHIVPLYFAGRDQRLSRYYVAMELVQGPTLAQLLAEALEGQIPVELALLIGVQVASALEHAHQRGILHLDVKPSNILWQPKEALSKLTDFGSARLREDAHAVFLPMPPGTPVYRPWEQTPAGRQAGIHPSERSDVYGLGATLYHLLTGNLPIPAKGGQLLPPSEWRSDLPPAFKTLLLRALHRDPQERPATMSELRRALEVVLAPQRVSIVSSPPLPTTRLVGRASLRHRLKQHLLVGGSRAPSALSGLPGVGKTALAAAIATDSEVQAHFTDGILWAGLGKTPDLLAILATWASRLEIPSEETARLRDLEAWSQVIRNRIGTRRILLVVDDAWSIEAALACRVGGPNSAYLLTTRSTELALQFAGEGLLPVPELTEDEGLALLAQLAPQVIAEQPTEAQALVRAVGGLPLGLILLGKHLQIQSYGRQPRRIHATLERLQQRSERLRVAQPQAPSEPHPSLQAGTPLSLQASISLSDTALSQEGQAMLRALAVFPPKPASFPEEAALAVSLGTTDTLDGMVDAGLVESGGAGRYTLHQTIVDYARLGGVPYEAEQRFVGWAVALIEMHQHNEPALEQELSLLLEALRLPLAEKDQTLLLQGSTALVPFLLARGLYATAEDLLKSAQVIAREQKDVRVLIAVSLQFGRLAVLRGAYEQAVTCYQEGIRLARQVDAVPQLSALLQSLGWVLQNQGDLAQAQVALEEGLVLARQEKQTGTCAGILINLGAVASRRGEHEQAESFYQAGLELAHTCQDSVRMAAALQGLAYTAVRRGNYHQAESYYQQGIALARHLGHRARLSTLICGLGALALDQGHFEQAEDALRDSLHLARELGYREGICIALRNLAEVVFRLGHVGEAQTALEEGLALARQMGHYEYLCSLLYFQGEVSRKLGALAEAEAALQEGEVLARKRGHRWHLSRVLCGWGRFHLETQRLEAADQSFTEALALACEVESQEREADARYGLAQVAAVRGQPEYARQQAEESLRLFEQVGFYQAVAVQQWLIQLEQGSDEVGRQPRVEVPIQWRTALPHPPLER